MSLNGRQPELVLKAWIVNLSEGELANLATVLLDDKEDMEQLECQGLHAKEVECDSSFAAILKKRKRTKRDVLSDCA